MLAKILIDKSGRTEKTTTFKYPANYVAEFFEPFLYQNEGLDQEWCVAKVKKGFTDFSDEIVKITKKQAETLIGEFVDKDKDFIGGKKDQEGEEITKENIKKIKLNHTK